MADHPSLPVLSAEMLPVLDLLPDAVTVSRDGRILYANMACVKAIGARHREELLDQALEDLVVPEQRPILKERVRTQEGGVTLPAIEYEGITLDGRRVTVEVHVSPVQFEGAPAMLALVRDITRRRQAEQELQKTQKIDAVGRLAGGIAHDFNSLLAIIHGNAELLLAAPCSLGEDRELIQHIHQASSRAAALVRRLLAFSRIQAHRPGTVHLEHLVHEFLPIVGRLLGDDIRVVEDFDSSVPPVWADVNEMEQVLLNLVLNARDALPHGGTLRLELRAEELGADSGVPLPPGRYAALTGSDDGEGMDEEVAAQAPLPFFTTKPAGQGTGLGLSTVVDILRNHHGALTLQSRPREGTRATAWIPVREGPRPAPAERAPGEGTESILLVDDEPTLVKVLQRGLSRAGFRVLEAANAEQALDILTRETVDAVVSDIAMPGRSGLDLAQDLRRLRPGMPILLMTGYSERIAEARSAGLPVLEKPFRLAELTARLRDCLDRTSRPAGQAP